MPLNPHPVYTGAKSSSTDAVAVLLSPVTAPTTNSAIDTALPQLAPYPANDDASNSLAATAPPPSSQDTSGKGLAAKLPRYTFTKHIQPSVPAEPV